jgi:hypothetical protein
MRLKRGRIIAVILFIALSMILIFGFRASAQKNHAHEALSQAPEKKTPETQGRHEAGARIAFSLHPAARYATTSPTAYEDEDLTESEYVAAFIPRTAHAELIHPDLNSYVRISDGGNATPYDTGASLFSSSPAPPSQANSPLLFYYNPPATSPGNSTNPSNPSTGNPSYSSTGNSSYPSIGNSSYAPTPATTGSSSPTPVPSSILLLGSGLIALCALRQKTVSKQRPKHFEV